MNYAESLNYIYHAKQAGAEKRGLANITELLKRLGNPEALFPAVHVAGTNGKGSTCAFLESILRAAGYKTGLYTSPYLERFTERIRVGGQEIEEEEFAALAMRVRAAADTMVAAGLAHPTFFELTTACCFLHFAERKVDVAVVETGLGGRTDATNVLTPLLSVITAIGMDHEHALGGTIERIAAEKAGIIKHGVPCVLSVGSSPAAVHVIDEAARACNSPLIRGSDWQAVSLSDGLEGQRFALSWRGIKYENLEIKLLGRHQLDNAATAILAALELRRQGYAVGDDAIREGLLRARWPGRMELVRQYPPVLIDGAHNPQGAEALAVSVRTYLKNKPICLVMGAMADKDAGPMVRQFASFAASVITTLPPAHGRLERAPEELARMFSDLGVKAAACPDWRQALASALASGQAVVVAGSLYLAGAARTWLLSQSPDSSPGPSGRSSAGAEAVGPGLPVGAAEAGGV